MFRSSAISGGAERISTPSIRPSMDWIIPKHNNLTGRTVTMRLAERQQQMIYRNITAITK